MKKFIYLLSAIAALTACGDDDEPYTPELNKLTNVTCTKNGVAFFQADITYDEQQRINRIVLNQEGTQSVDNYIFVDNTLSCNCIEKLAAESHSLLGLCLITCCNSCIKLLDSCAYGALCSVIADTALSFLTFSLLCGLVSHLFLQTIPIVYLFNQTAVIMLTALQKLS